MFGNKYTEEYVDGLRSQIKKLEQEKKEIVIENENNSKNIVNEHEFKLKRLVLEKEIEIKQIESSIDDTVKKQVKDTLEKMTRVEKENAVLVKELEVYTKAFQNMGVDVKDMKEIMQELIKGIVSKNTVSVIK